MKIKKFNEHTTGFESQVRKTETWKDIFKKQVSSGKYWEDLFDRDGSFERHKFLDASDAVHICKKAQSDVYDELKEKYKDNAEIVNELETLKQDMWNSDDSGLSV